MAWFTIEEAAERGPSRRHWRQQIDAGEAQSYVDSFGRTLVWVDEDAPPPVDPRQMIAAYSRVLADVAALRHEVAQLRREVTTLRAKPAPTRAPEPTIAITTTLTSSRSVPRIVVTEPEPPAETNNDPHPASAHTDLLRQIEQTWTGSDRELERLANLPKAFLAKAKKGQRNGPRSQASWDRLAAFMTEQAVA